jgi:hypothetical protein
MAKKKGAVETIFSGLAFTIVFSILWAFSDGWWWIFPLVFAGILPLMEGLRRFIAERARRVKIEPGQREALEEKEVLKLAQIEQGIVTPALVALKTNLTADRAEKILQNLAKRGFTLMQVTEDGRVEYEFPEFKPRIESSPG